jgi:hypothetical protein
MNARMIGGVVICLGALLTSACDGGGGGEGGGGTGGNGGGDDPHEAYHAACVDKINALRATKALPALARWTEAEACVDQQATEDAMTGMAHGAWSSGKYDCNGKSQNECLGAGAEGTEGCLDSMWAEKDQAGCSGCDACADAYDASCPNCDFFGTATGDVCGHYVNLSAKYVTRAACGFSDEGGWVAINFD